MALLEELTQIWGVSGREKQVRKRILQEVEPFADEIRIDNIGNLIVLKRGRDNPKHKTIMLSAHMDEIGYQVTRIDDDGKIRVCNVGWTWTGSIYNDKVIFQNGIIGVAGCECPIEEAKNDVTKLYFDIGCTSRDDAEKYVKVGDYAGFIGTYHELANQKITAKSLDDRAGCYMLIEALKRNDGTYPNDICYVFSVQEEVGCRGAVVAAEAVRPDIGISIDVTPDHFYPTDLKGANAVGNGIGIKLGDPSAMLDEYLVEEMLACCEENDIPFQRDVMDRGGTDAGSINLSHYGVRVCGISLVDRFPHSQSSIVSMTDINAGITLIDKYVQRTFDFTD